MKNTIAETKEPNHLKAERLRLQKRRQGLLEAFSKAVGSGKMKRLSELCAKIRQTNEFLNSLELIETDAQAEEGAGPRHYVVSSLFLYESLKKLTPDPDESFFFVTGSEVGGALVLDQWAEFAYQKRSFVGATGDPSSTHALLIKLEQFGHRLLAHFHSHPGKGADSTRPSGTDENFQGRLESAGHVAVMVIFTRDGFVRFVRLDQNLGIEVHGKGVEEYAPGIYRLTNLG